MSELESIIIDAQKGNHHAFGQIVLRFQDMAYAVALGRVGNTSMANQMAEEVAEEVAQEAFLEAYQHLPKLETPAAFPGWFRTIVLRQCSRIQRRARLAVVPLEQAFALASPCPGPGAVAESRERQQLVHQQIMALPEHERDVVTLFYIAEYSQKEIASLLNIRVSAVKNRLFSARNRLRNRMTDMKTNMRTEMMAEMMAETTKSRPSQDDSFVKSVLEFIVATEVGDTEKVTQMLGDAPQLANARGQARYAGEELAPLHNAAVYGYVEIAQSLLQCGADVNDRSQVGWTPLLCALMAGQQQMVQLLLEAGATVDIFAAAKMGDLTAVNAFLQQNSIAVHARGPRGATPLHFAATPAVAQSLLDHGADIHARDESGSERQRYGTPLRWHADEPDMAELLLAHGAEVDDIFLACSLGDMAHVQTFMAQYPGSIHEANGPYRGQLIHLAADKGYSIIVRLLLDRGADVNATSADGQVTPLHLAASSGHLETVRLLVEEGANLHAVDSEMHGTPQGWAKFWQQETVVRYLHNVEAEQT